MIKFDDATAERYTKFQKWTNAKTYEKFCPHEYIALRFIPLREREWFYEFVRYIRENGFPAYYGSNLNMYRVLGEYYYWTMGAPVEQTTIINRARLKDYLFQSHIDGSVHVVYKNQV